METSTPTRLAAALRGCLYIKHSWNHPLHKRRWAGGTEGASLGHCLPPVLPAACGHWRRCFANVPFFAHCLALVVWPKRDCRAWQPQLLSRSRTKSGCALIFPLFSDCTHPSFYITGDTISNKIKDERYRTH